MKRLTTAIRGNQIRSQNPLTDAELLQHVPSMFAEAPYHDRSDRYAFIPTIDIVQALRKEGFEIFFAAQAIPRIADKHNFAKMMFRARRPEHIQSKRANEVIVCASHDGTCTTQILGGIIEWACANSHVVGSIIEDVRVRHTGAHALDKVIEGVYNVVNEFSMVDEHIEEMQAIKLNPKESYEFGRAAMMLKYDDVDKAPVTVQQVIEPRRWEDDSPSLWANLNRVQENLIRGGLRGVSQPNEVTGKRRRVTTRPVQGITENVKLNQAIWSLAEAMANIKSAA